MYDKFPQEVIRKLKYYVYAYVDPGDQPEDQSIFYIGKGKGNRAFDHLRDESESDKVKRIKEIQKRGKKPEIWILRYGLTSSGEAEIAEATAIDAVGLTNLTNKMRGIRSRSFGRIPAEKLIRAHQADVAELRHPAILITISKLFRDGMKELQLYEATRGVWKLKRKRLTKYTYAFAIFHNVIKEVYEITEWHKGGDTPYYTRDHDDVKKPERWEFVGEVAKSIRDQYVGRVLPHEYRRKRGNQNPIKYFP